MHRLPILAAAAALLAGCVTTHKQAQAQAQTELGAAYLREGNAPAALEVLGKAVKEDPRNWEAWDRLGLAYWAQGDFARSEKAFARGVHLVPDKAEINNNYGLMLMAMGRNGEAISRFEEARKDLLYRKPALVLNNLGHALYLEGRYQESLAVLDQALQRAPELCNAHFHRALVYEALDRKDGALSSYEEVIRLCGASAPGAWYHAGLLLVERGDREAACAYFSSAIEAVAPGSDLYQAATSRKALDCP